MNPLRITRTIAVAIVAVSATACLMKSWGRVSGLKNEPLSVGTPRYYDVALDSCVRAVHSAMQTVGLTVREVRHVSDSVWMLTGEKSLSDQYDLEYVRAVVTDSGRWGILVRVVTRLRECDDYLMCEASDTESGTSALRMLAVLDHDLPRKPGPAITP